MLIAFMIMLFGYLLLAINNFKKYSKEKILWVSLLYFYIWIILFLTIVPKDFTINPYWRDIKPIYKPYDNFKPYYDFLLNRKGAITDIVLNILMMIPFGFLYSKVKQTNAFKVIFITFIFTLFIETTQLLTTKFLIYNRNFDVTDIINNTIGGLIGYLLYKGLKHYRRKIN